MKYCTACNETLDNSEFSNYEIQNLGSVCISCMYFNNVTFFSRELQVGELQLAASEIKRILWRHHFFIEEKNDHSVRIFRECYRFPASVFGNYFGTFESEFAEIKAQEKLARELVFEMKDVYSFQKHDHRRRSNGVAFEFVCQRMSRINQLERNKRRKPISSSNDANSPAADKSYDFVTHTELRPSSRGSRDEEASPCSGRLTVAFERDTRSVKIVHSHIPHPQKPVMRIPGHVSQKIEESILKATETGPVTIASLFHELKDLGVSRSQVRYQFKKIMKKYMEKEANES